MTTRINPGVLVVIAMLSAPTAARAQAAPADAKAPTPAGSAEFLVPPQGLAVEVPLHTGTVCILSFPEKLETQALTSSRDFEIEPWRESSIAVRIDNGQAAPTTIALATATGQIKVNVTLRVVSPTERALTMVHFRAVSDVEAFEARVMAEVSKRLDPARQRLEREADRGPLRPVDGSTMPIASGVVPKMTGRDSASCLLVVRRTLPCVSGGAAICLP